MQDPKFIENNFSSVSRKYRRASVAGDADTQALAAYQQDVIVDSTLGTLTVYLPDVSEAKGKIYSVTATTGGTKTVTVSEKASGNSLDWPGDSTLNADNDRGLYFSDGQKWWVLTDQFT